MANATALQSTDHCREVRVAKREDLNAAGALKVNEVGAGGALKPSDLNIPNSAFPLTFKDCGHAKYYALQYNGKTYLVDKTLVKKICVQTSPDGDPLAGSPGSGSSNICPK